MSHTKLSQCINSGPPVMGRYDIGVNRSETKVRHVRVVEVYGKHISGS